MTGISLIQEWFRYSHNDLIVARHSFEDLHPKQTEIACYLCQQCAEKALKAYLLFKEIDPPRIHNLVQLCQMCMDFDGAFSTIQDACADLSPFAATVRYPNELAPDDAIAKRAIDKAQQVYDFCASKIPEMEKREQPVVSAN
jgi:HEPN domain-containing protein